MNPDLASPALAPSRHFITWGTPWIRFSTAVCGSLRNAGFSDVGETSYTQKVPMQVCANRPLAPVVQLEIPKQPGLPFFCKKEASLQSEYVMRWHLQSMKKVCCLLYDALALANEFEPPMVLYLMRRISEGFHVLRHGP